jgi:hypothetical protein
MVQRSVQDLFAELRDLLGTVPDVRNGFVCPLCLGPRRLGYPSCFGCKRLLTGQVPAALQKRVVPMTAAAVPSTWYSVLQKYKAGGSQYAPFLAALAYTYVTEHRSRIEKLLGGPATLTTIVPSKRPGRTFKEQRIGIALHALTDDRFHPIETLRYRKDANLGRQQYDPGVFRPRSAGFANERVLLFEDTWVSGATSLSAAGALLDGGAESVVLLPLARDVDLEFWGEQHPYVVAMKEPYEVERWPR